MKSGPPSVRYGGRRLSVALAILATSAAASAQSFPIPPADRAPTTIVVESEERSDAHRGLQSTSAVLVRHAIGPSWRVPTEHISGKAVFGYDLFLSGRFGFGDRPAVPAVWPEIGYSFVGPNGHFAHVGVGPAVQRTGRARDLVVSLGLVPRVLYGMWRGRPAAGARLSLVVEDIDSFTSGVELSYGFIHVDEITVHEVRLAFTLGTFLGGRWQK